MRDLPAGDSGEFYRALKHAIAPADEAFTLPPVCYRDGAIQELERDLIFRKHWLGVGRADRVKSPGDFAALEIAGVPLILLRDAEGVLRAFANTCRHRGARLLEGEGSCRRISCPFHGWTYKLDGSLTGGPALEETKDFDKSQFGLIDYRVEERAGFVFVCFDDTAPDLDRQLGDFEALHAPWPLEGLVTTRRRSLTVNCNWKAFLEVFNEYYHLPYIHPKSINRVYKAPDAPDETNGDYTSQFGETEGTGGLMEKEQDHVLPGMANLQGRAARGTRYTWLFPNLTFAAGNEGLWVYEAYPLEPQRCLIHQSLCFPPETVRQPDFAERVAYYYRRMDAALDEDIPALENQQRGLASPDARQGRFSATLEPSVAAFANWYARKLLQAISRLAG